jgi:hypothetical protein
MTQYTVDSRWDSKPAFTADQTYDRRGLSRFFPRLPQLNATDRGLIDSKPIGQIDLAFFAAQSANFFGNLWRYLAVPLLMQIARKRLQVVGIHARCVFTAMVKIMVGGDISETLFPQIAIRKHETPIGADSTISGQIPVARPIPATRFGIDLVSLFNLVLAAMSKTIPLRLSNHVAPSRRVFLADRSTSTAAAMTISVRDIWGRIVMHSANLLERFRGAAPSAVPAARGFSLPQLYHLGGAE